MASRLRPPSRKITLTLAKIYCQLHEFLVLWNLSHWILLRVFAKIDTSIMNSLCIKTKVTFIVEILTDLTLTST